MGADGGKETAGPTYDEFCPKCGAGRRGPISQCVKCGHVYSARPAPSSPSRPDPLRPTADEGSSEAPLSERTGSMVFILTVPLIALAVAFFVNLTQADELPVGVQISEVCADQRFSGEPFCFVHSIAAVIPPVAVGTIVTLATLLALIGVGQRWVAQRPGRILTVFLPGLLITQLSVIGMMIAVGFLGAAVAFLVPVMLLDVVIPSMLGLIAIGIGLGIFGVLRAIAGMGARALVDVLGNDVTREQEPELHRLVDDVARRVGAEPPGRIIVGLEPQFFVTEADVRSLDGLRPARTLVISGPVSRQLSIRELEALLVGHEMAHFQAGDIEMTRRFFPVYRSAVSSLIAILATTGDITRLIVLPPVAVISRFLDAFSTVAASISRERELAADKQGAEATRTSDMATALFTVHRCAEAWPGAVDALADELTSGAQPTATVAAFLDTSVELSPESRSELDRQSLGHPTDTHPPLSHRLSSLGLTFAAVMEEARRTPVEPAAALIRSLDSLETRQTAEYRGKLAQMLGLGGIPVAPASGSAGTGSSEGTDLGGRIVSGQAVRIFDPLDEYIGPAFEDPADAEALLTLATIKGRDIRSMRPEEAGRARRGSRRVRWVTSGGRAGRHSTGDGAAPICGRSNGPQQVRSMLATRE